MDLKLKIPKVKKHKVSNTNVSKPSYEALDGEIWSPIRFNPSYKVSNKGRVLTTRNTIAKPFKNNKGYLCIGLWYEGVKHNITVHKLVAMHFMNYDDSYDIDHIDGNKENNDVTNLRLVTHQLNCKLRNNPKVVQVNADGTVINNYDSYRQAAHSLGYSEATLRKNLKNSEGIVMIRNYKYHKDCYFIRK